MSHPRPGAGLTLKPVSEIAGSGMKFFIPSYQRGYRWEDGQVEALLQDLAGFFREETRKLYCLQPLVVVRRGDRWEVVDGQQRLSTLFLILRQLDPSGGPPFEVHYERLPEYPGGLWELLARNDASRSGTPDAYYLTLADEVIRKFLKIGTNMEALRQLPMATDRQASFIWYELPEKDAIPAFARLNAGKIPLTDVELIRAMFLREDLLTEAGRWGIGLAWDLMEKRLNDAEFWNFVSPPSFSPANRIELLFRLVSEPAKDEDSPRGLFSEFERRLKAGAADTLVEWRGMEDAFAVLEEWHADAEVYHLVGFLSAAGVSSVGLFRNEWRTAKRKADFTRSLKKRIRSRLFGKERIAIVLDRTGYGDPKVREVLLLFNIATLVNETMEASRGDVRFSFASFRNEGWDIEHISANASTPPEDKEELAQAITLMMAYLDENRGSHGDPRKKRRDELQAIYQEKIGKFSVKGQEAATGNGIENLALLDFRTNRGYGCSPFPVKRDWVLNIDRRTTQLLPGTRDVFTKSYSRIPGSPLAWTREDAAAYKEKIITTLEKLLR